MEAMQRFELGELATVLVGLVALFVGRWVRQSVPLLARLDMPALLISASASVQTKNTVAQAAVDRDRKLALPVAPNRLPEEPLPNEAPMSAPLPCCTSTRPIITSAAMIWRATSRLCRKFIRVDSEDSSAAGRQAPARQMATKSLAFNEAPPIRPPSMSACENSVAALSALTLPP